jgi:6-phosphogluconate dehydrogenase
MAQAFGVVGLDVMGRNLALNVERNGFPVAVFNRTYAKTEHFISVLAKGKKALGARSPQEFCSLIDRPRKILLMVKAGMPVDAEIAELKPYLLPGDVIIDGGNSLFTDTERRAAELEQSGTGIKFFGMGISGGEEGALWGPSMMPGGDQAAYQHLEPILVKVAAKTEDDGPCVTYIGARGSGHFVKMVHNGIEYGDMQLIAEAYDLLKNVGGLTNRQLKDVFAEWNSSELKSFLIEITSKVVDFADAQIKGASLIDQILDVVGMKGTGTWTIKAALDLLVPIPTIAAAVDAREISMLKQQRVEASKVLAGPQPKKIGSGSASPAMAMAGLSSGQLKQFIADVRAALYCSKICSYAQGMTLIATANKSYAYGIRLDEVARIWKAGCIIRAAFLDDIKHALKDEPELPNLLMASRFREAMAPRQDAWRRVVNLAANNGIGTPAFSASLAYYDSYRRARLPGNLIQAQRDFFGAHTYERLDAVGTAVHTEWEDVSQRPSPKA